MKSARVATVIGLLVFAGCLGTVAPGEAGTSEGTTQLNPADEDEDIGYRLDDGTLEVTASGPGLTCTGVAVDAIWDVLESRIDADFEGIGVGHRTTDEYEGWVVTRTVTLDGDGEVVSEPSIPAGRLREVAPEEATVSLENGTTTTSCSEPVTVVNRTIREY